MGLKRFWLFGFCARPEIQIAISASSWLKLAQSSLKLASVAMSSNSMPRRLFLFVAFALFVGLFTGTPLCEAAKRGRKYLRGTSSESDAAAPEPPRSSTDISHKKGGGSKQRLRETVAEEAAQASNRNRIVDGPLTADLKRRWAKGKLTSEAVQSLASNAKLQGAQDLDRLSKIGSSGLHPQNLFRDVCKVFGEPYGSPGMDWIEIPIKGKPKALHPVFWPHKFFQAMAANRPDIWANRIRGVEGAARQFWTQMEQSDFVINHPFLPSASYDNIIPLGFHGDGGSFNKQDSLFALSWNSLLGTGPTIQSKFLFTVVRKSEMTQITLDTLIRAFSWSCNVLLSGETPHSNWLDAPLEGGGRELASGYRGALCQIRGDWEFLWQLFHFGRWDGAVEMCPFCRASASIREHSWTDFTADAWWRDTVWTHDTYMDHLRMSGRPIPVMFGRGGVIGLRLSNVMVDILHTVDQGFGSHIIGNILWYFVILSACFGGRTYADRILLCAADLKQWYRRNPQAYKIKGPLTKERVRADGDWPKLKAKAAATRHLAWYALDVATRFANLTSLDEFTRLHDELSLGVIQLLCEFYKIINQESMFFSDGAKARMPVLADQLCGIYSRLSTMAFARNLRLWKLSPKLHLFMHLCINQCLDFGNPRFWWTYGDEDLVGIMINIAEGVHPTTLAASVMPKWLFCVFDQLYVDPDDEP
jgi:hypothetical protein